MTSQFAQFKQLPLDLALDKRATLESFLPGRNRGVVQQIEAIDSRRGWLYLWGPTGSGKTHLLNAACHEAGEQGRRSCLVPLQESERFTPDFIATLNGLDLICFDDVDSIAGAASWEQALFHFLNRVRGQPVTVLVSAKKRPDQLHLDLPDLRSRLGWDTLVKVYTLSDEEKIKALQLRAKLRGFDLPTESAQYLMRRVARNTRDLMAILDRLDTASLQAKRKLTVRFLKDWMTGAGARTEDRRQKTED